VFKTILVNLVGTPDDGGTLDTALAVARLFNGHLVCTRIHPDIMSQVLNASGIDMGSGTGAVAETFQALSEEERKASENTKAAFQAFIAREKLPIVERTRTSGVTVSWREMQGTPDDVLSNMGRYCDLIVVGPRGGKNTQLTSVELGNVVLDCGRPILISPPKRALVSPRKIAVAWKDSPESARAVTAAMPLLSQAKQVIVLGAAEEEDACLPCADSCRKIAECIDWQGVETDSALVVPGGRSSADAILDRAMEKGADMLVMGGFGHSRLRETIFGGFTRQILERNPLPIFIFH